MKKTISLLILIITLLLLSSCEMGNEGAVHTVIFYDGFGGTSVQDVADGKTASKPLKNPVAPPLCGKGSFRTWVTKGSSGMETEYDFSQPVKRDISLFAVYYDSVTVYFYDSDNTLITTQDVSAGTEYRITKPADPVSKNENDGKFNCWTLVDKSVWDFNTPVQDTVNLYATYNSLHTVTYYNGANFLSSEKVSDGERATGPVSDPVSSDRGSFCGWSTEYNGGAESAYSLSSPVTDDISLYAYFRDARYVTLLDPDGSEIGKIKVDFLSLFPVPEMKKIGNSIIKTWQTEKSGSWTDYDFTNPVDTDITLKAVVYDEAERKDVLSMMRFAEILSSCPGDRTGEGTTAGFLNTELARLFLAASSYIDEDTLSLSYTSLNLNKDYVYYLPGEDPVQPENILCVEIVDADYTRFVSAQSDGVTKITATGLEIEAKIAPGKVENGIVVKDGDYFESSSISIIFESVTLTTDGEGNFCLETVETGGVTRTLKLQSVKGEKSTVTTFIYGENGTEEKAAEMTFCTVSFDPRNGEETETERVLSGKTVQEPDEKPLDAYGSSTTFQFWSADGTTGYDFDKEVTENITLRAVYTTRDEFNILLEAECIYRLSDVLLSADQSLYAGSTSIDEIFPNSSESDSDYDLTRLLLCSLESINSSEKLFIEYGGKEYVYDTNELSFQVYKLPEEMSIGKNSSSKDGKTTKIKLDDVTIALQFKYFEGGSRKWFLDCLKNTFSIDADIAEDDDGVRTMTAQLKSGDRTYSSLKTTMTPQSDGKEKVEFEYSDKKFTRFY